MFNRVEICGLLHTGPRTTILQEDNTPVTFFEIQFVANTNRKTPNVKKATISCVSYGQNSKILNDRLSKFKPTSEGGTYTGESPLIYVSGSIQTRKIRVGTDKDDGLNKKIRIQEVNVEYLEILEKVTSISDSSVTTETAQDVRDRIENENI